MQLKYIIRKFLNKEELERVNIEAYVMNNFNHKNILRFKQIIEDNENVYMILEYAKNGDLLEYIKNKNRLSEQEARCFFIQILNALEYTHDIGIIHRDIKLENILLNEKNEIILGDWGFASQWSPQKKLTCNWGSLFYSPPEVYLGIEYIGPEVDVWSLGVVLYAMVIGNLPFEGVDNTEIVTNILAGNFIIPEFCSNNLVSLLTSMIKVDPEKRITIKEIRNNPWLKPEKQLYRRSSFGACVSVKSDQIEHGLTLPINRERKKSILEIFFSRLLPKPKTPRL